MQCRLPIDVNVVKESGVHPIAYKYVIHSPNRRGKGIHPWEVLHNPQYKRPKPLNRGLCVPAASSHDKGM